MKNIFFFSLLCCLLGPLASLHAQKDWVFQKEKNGVKIYKKKSDAGHEVKLMSTFGVSTAAMVALFNNVAEYPNWGYHVAYSELLKRVSDTEFYYYSRFDFPWPLDDRDVVMHTTITTDPATKIVTLSSLAVPDYIPEKEGLVRVRKANVSWTLKPLDGQSTEGTYTLNTDPGGLLPDWTVNLANDTGPVETVQRMKKLLEEDRYKNAKRLFAVCRFRSDRRHW
jgi:hypothetical protein